MTEREFHRSWAAHYDEVNRSGFGPWYDHLTAITLEQIRGLENVSRIVDCGAGTGRLSIPLAKGGYAVTAVEPSGAMLEQLARKDASKRIRMIQATMADFDATEVHDLAIAVFTVIAYILTPEELTASLANVARALTGDGQFLLDVPRKVLFQDSEVHVAGLTRAVRFTKGPGSVYVYHEASSVELPTGVEEYEDTVTLRYWHPHEVRGALEKAGFVVEHDLSPMFPGVGADYWLCRKIG